MTKTLRTLAFHPFLFAIYPVVFLAAHNVREAAGPAVFSSGVLLVLAAFVLFIPSRLFLKQSDDAALLTSLFLILFFSFGQAVQWAEGKRLGGFTLGRPSLVAAVWFLLGIAGAAGLRKIKDKSGWMFAANLFSSFLVGLNFLTIALAQPSMPKFSYPETAGVFNTETPFLDRPDVYYVILDSYARADLLKRVYDLDNQPFLDELKRRGFRVLSESRSNYRSTHSSLASSLNMQYLDVLTQGRHRYGIDTREAAELIRENVVAKLFRSRGYAFAAFSSGYPVTEIRNADLYYSPRWALNEFHHTLLNMTPMPWFFSVLDRLNLTRMKLDPYAAHRHRINYLFEHWPELAQNPEPTFTFIHFLVPRAPYLWTETGGERRPGKIFSLIDEEPEQETAELRQLYADQLLYVNQKILQAVDKILADSSSPPVIVLQADHGPGGPLLKDQSEKEMIQDGSAIFHAVYAPERLTGALGDTVSPVNTFRILFNELFDARFPVLEDKTF